MFYAIKMR